MNKKLLPLAIGVALSAGSLAVAQAGEVKVYGMAQVEVASADSNFKSTYPGYVFDESVDGTLVNDNARGRMGVTASEDLGNGLKGIAKFEWRINTDQGGRDAGNRESFVGLQGSWGTFQAGALKSPYKYTGGIKYDPFVATNLEARGNGGMSGNDLAVFGLNAGASCCGTLPPMVAGLLGPGGLDIGTDTTSRYGHNGFLENSLGYWSPVKRSIKFSLVYSPDETTGGANGDDGDYAASIVFNPGAWEIFAAAVHNSDNDDALTDTVTDYDAIKIGGKVKFGSSTIVGQYETGEQELSDPVGSSLSVDNDTLFLGYHLDLGGNNTLVVQYGMTEFDIPAFAGDPAITIETDYIAIGAIHKFSKTTRVFGGYRTTETDVTGNILTAETDVISIGLRKDF